jgi:transposase
MLSAKQRDAGKERFWRRLVRQWQASGLSVRAFCAREGLTEPSFYAWRRALTERDTQPGFVPVRVAAEGNAAGSDDAARALELHLPLGRVLRIGMGFDAATLRRLLALLEEGQACC